jgi:hypothetical protein
MAAILLLAAGQASNIEIAFDSGRCLSYLWLLMSFFDKYPKLKERKFLVELMVKTVYSTMALENQTVETSMVKDIVLSVIKEQESHNSKLSFN